MLADDFWQFVEDNADVDPSTLRLKYHGQGREFEIVQIECRKKFGKKLAWTLARDPWLLFPSVLAGEQSTSDRLAEYHASLIGDGSRVVDLTAGLGIDAMHFARKAKEVTALDYEKKKAECLEFNLRTLHLDNARAVHADCREYVGSYLGEKLDAAFIDPARRADDGSRIYVIADCQPNVTEMLPAIGKMAKQLIVKASPMLDISKLAADLPGTSRVIALGSATECKELIAIVCIDGIARELEVSAVTLFADGTASEFTFTQAQEKECVFPDYRSLPKEGDWLYEPYPSVMKAAPFCLISTRYGVKPLHANTHLYYSAERIDDFPGTAMQIERVITYESKHIKRLKKEYPKIQVATRNFDISADALRRKLGVSEGGDKRLVGVTLSNGKPYMLVLKPAPNQAP